MLNMLNLVCMVKYGSAFGVYGSNAMFVTLMSYKGIIFFTRRQHSHRQRDINDDFVNFKTLSVLGLSFPKILIGVECVYVHVDECMYVFVSVCICAMSREKNYLPMNSAFSELFTHELSFNRRPNCMVNMERYKISFIKVGTHQDYCKNVCFFPFMCTPESGTDLLKAVSSGCAMCHDEKNHYSKWAGSIVE
jgi:hypothetical protein